MDEREEEVVQTEYDYSDLVKWIDATYVVTADDRVAAVQQVMQFYCARCRESWSAPALTLEQRKEVADLVRRKNMFEPLEFFRLTGFTFLMAKRTMHHITIVPGKCHKCKRGLPDDSEQVVCRCRSLNLNW